MPKKRKEEVADADLKEEVAAPAKRAKAPKPSKPYRRPDFGETVYVVQYAASGRSACKVCGEKISQGEVRLGLTTPGGGIVSRTRTLRLRGPTSSGTLRS
jgi:hypothetical protein